MLTRSGFPGGRPCAPAGLARVGPGPGRPRPRALPGSRDAETAPAGDPREARTVFLDEHRGRPHGVPIGIINITSKKGFITGVQREAFAITARG